jgi:arylsulfatase A
MTGRYHLRTGVQWVTRGLERMDGEETTLAELFNHNDYQTALFGKWHNGAMAPFDPLSQGFGEFFGFAAGHWNTYFDASLQYGSQMVQTKGYLADVLTDSTISFIERQINSGSPFFAYVAFNTPHSPFQVPDEFYQRFINADMPEKDKAVYAMIENLDYNIDRITKSLEKNTALENTLIIFLGDNGPNGVRYNAGLKGIKASVHEGGLKVPSFWHWPNKWREGNILDGWATHIDIFPTLVGLLDLDIPTSTKPIDGKDISNQLNSGEIQNPDKMHFSHHSQTVDLQPLPGSVRAGNFRAVSYEEDNWELYDLASDPNQELNIATQNEDLVDSLSKAYMTWFKEVSANLPLERWTPIDVKPILSVEIPAHEAHAEGAAKYAGGFGWAGDWISGFANNKAAVIFPIINQEYASYTVQIKYSLPKVASSSIPAIHFNYRNEERVTQRIGSLSLAVKKAEIIDNPDRIERGEAPEKEWITSEKTVISIPKGKGYISIQAITESGLAELEIKSIILQKIP